MSIAIYANGQLGQERDLLELLQIGSLDTTKVSAGVIENFVPELKVLSLPYLFRDSAHISQILHGKIGKKLLEKGDKYWLRGLCFYDAGSGSFYSKKTPIEVPENLKGLKVRVMNSQTAINMIGSVIKDINLYFCKKQMKHSGNILCRYCDSADLQKNGKDRGKKQRDRCKHCKKNFILNYSYNACKKGVKEQIDKMLLNSSGTRDIGSVLNISKDTVTAHIKKKTTKVNLNYSQRSNEMERKNLEFQNTH